MTLITLEESDKLTGKEIAEIIMKMIRKHQEEGKIKNMRTPNDTKNKTICGGVD